MEPAEHESKGAAPRSRWLRWAAVSAALNGVTLVIYPAFISWCCFHFSAAVVGVVPVLWGAYTFAAYSLPGERLIGCTNAMLAIWWLYYTWETNVQFLF